MKVSSAYAELTNIIEAAKWHREHCNGQEFCPVCHGRQDVADGPTTKPCPNPECNQGLVAQNCNVALYLLGMTAKRLVDHCWLSERNTARRLIHEAGCWS